MKHHLTALVSDCSSDTLGCDCQTRSSYHFFYDTCLCINSLHMAIFWSTFTPLLPCATLSWPSSSSSCSWLGVLGHSEGVTAALAWYVSSEVGGRRWWSSELKKLFGWESKHFQETPPPRNCFPEYCLLYLVYSNLSRLFCEIVGKQQNRSTAHKQFIKVKSCFQLIFCLMKLYKSPRFVMEQRSLQPVNCNVFALQLSSDWLCNPL